jgi:hypothetical protein
MKLRELRELYEAPEDDLDDFDADEDGAQPAFRGVAMGIDLAIGSDSTVAMYQFTCSSCNLQITVNPPLDKSIFVPLCPKCDACACCGKLYDDLMNPLTMKTVARFWVRDGEMMREQLNVCPTCAEDSDKMRALASRKT